MREKIKTSQLINRLQDHALSGKELSASQIKAIEVLIRKTLPDLTAVAATFSNPDGSALELKNEAKSEVTDLFGPPRLVVNNA